MFMCCYNSVICIMHTDIIFGFLAGEQSYKLLCQPGVIDWTKMNKIYGMFTGTGISAYFMYLAIVYSVQGVHSRIFNEITL